MKYYIDIFFENKGWKGTSCADWQVRENCLFVLDDEGTAIVVAPIHAIKYWETREN